MISPRSPAVAIVGLACIYPDARSPKELWENVLAQRRAFRRIPAERLSSEDYFSEDPSAPDKSYARQAAVIEGYEFDRAAFNVVGSTYRSADLTHWLALDVAAQALEDAGFSQGEGLPHRTTGVLLGNTLTGEFSRANLMRLRWPYVRRVLDAALAEQGWDATLRNEFIQRVETQYKAPFPAVGEETLAGGLSNTIAGRICNQFNLKGGGYTLDGACASSLLAVANACANLDSGDLDVALAGGVDLSLDPFELVGFAKTRALTPDVMRVYDADSSGFCPGEGCGFAVLMRLADAEAQGRRVYAVIRGWGISSDGSGGITRPEVEGQLEALNRAYRRAGFGVDTVPYFEGHGTGTGVGDATELKVISRALRAAGACATPSIIGSIKANVGHTKAAAGIAGLIKATMAIHTQILPPTTGCERPHPVFHDGDAPPVLRTLTVPMAWPADCFLRAAVSAMGFGGINAHLVLEGAAKDRRTSLSMADAVLASSPQDSELFLFSAADSQALRQGIAEVGEYAERLSLSELSDLAASLAECLCARTVRAAVVASSPQDLAAKLRQIVEWLGEGCSTRLDPDSGIFLSEGEKPLRVGFLFPGQGSPLGLNGGIHARRYARVRELYGDPKGTSDSGSIATEIAQPAIARASAAGLRLMHDFGIKADIAIGHSLGELAALHWGGAFDEATLVHVATARGQAMGGLRTPTGTMAAISASAAQLRPLIHSEAVSLVGLNSPRQTVIAGEISAVEAVIQRACNAGMRFVSLPVSHAFHTPLVADAVPMLRRELCQLGIHPLERPVVSTVLGRTLDENDDLRELLCTQITEPVRFMDALETSSGVDLWIEIGPGKVLTGLVGECGLAPAISLDIGGPSLGGLLRVVGAAFALGAKIKPRACFEDRFTRPFSVRYRPRFFANPCETAPITNPHPKVGSAPRTPPAREAFPEPTTSTSNHFPQYPRGGGPVPDSIPHPQRSLELVREIVAARTELPVSAIRDQSRFLADLHLNSISVGQLVAETARRLELPPVLVPTDFSGATVLELAEALDILARPGSFRPAEEPDSIPNGVDAWTRPFVIDWVEAQLQRLNGVHTPATPGTNSWRIIAPNADSLADILRKEFLRCGGSGVVVFLDGATEEDAISALLEGSAAVRAMSGKPKFILAQSRRSSGSFAKSLHLEFPHITSCVLHLPAAHPSVPQWILEEAVNAVGHVEVLYDLNGVRRLPSMKCLELFGPGQATPLSSQDVLLVTGGGKGIAAECALALARTTGARLVLLGRIESSADAELRGNFARLEMAGVKFRYLAADVSNPATIRLVLTEVQEEWGPVTALLHAAGCNTPQSISTLDVTAFQKTLSPKIGGVRNVLAGIDPNRLRLFIAFGSIIGRGGLQGEADYAVANEWLTALVEEFQAQHPPCRCLAIEWSVWSGVGMGARLGRLESLRRQGISTISPEAGVEILDRLLRFPLPTTAVVVTGRFGEWPTLPIHRPTLPNRRFLQAVRIYYPGVELIVDSTLSSINDPYLEEHVYQGERLFPAVVGLEAMAQTAKALLETEQNPDFENVEFNRPIVVPKNGKLIIRIAALVRSSSSVQITVRSEESGFQVDHFRTTCHFAEAKDPTPSRQPALDTRSGDPSACIPFNIDRDLYDRLLFHGGRFRRVQNYRLLRAKECVAQVRCEPDMSWFDAHLPQDLALGDCGVRDAAIHAIQACLPHARLLPAGVRRITLGTWANSVATRTNPQLLLHAKEISRDGDYYEYDLELIDSGGLVIEQWDGLRLCRVDQIPHRRAWPVALLGPFLERRLDELTPSTRVSLVLARDLAGDEAIRQALGEPLPLTRRADGKPEAPLGRGVSASHSQNLTLAVAANTPVGCDLEPVTSRTPELWQDLLGSEGFRLAEWIAQSEDLDAAATRVWSAQESLKKCAGSTTAPLLFISRDPGSASSAPQRALACGDVCGISGRKDCFLCGCRRDAGSGRIGGTNQHHFTPRAFPAPSTTNHILSFANFGALIRSRSYRVLRRHECGGQCLFYELPPVAGQSPRTVFVREGAPDLGGASRRFGIGHPRSRLPFPQPTFRHGPSVDSHEIGSLG